MRRIYQFHYPGKNITQSKALISRATYKQYKEMPYATKEEQEVAKAWLKKQAGGMEWFPPGSPYWRAISTGVVETTVGLFPCKVRRIQ